MTATERSRRWREVHRDWNREYQREYQRRRRLDPEQRSKDAALLRRRYAEKADYYRERSRNWAKDNPEKACALVLRRRARKLGAPGNFTAKQFAELCKQHGGRCFYCGETRNLTVDHVVALSRGGTNDIANIVPACKPCNSSKGTKTIEEFLAMKGA